MIQRLFCIGFGQIRDDSTPSFHTDGEIEELTRVEEWRWIPTNENMADEATRDTSKQCY